MMILAIFSFRIGIQNGSETLFFPPAIAAATAQKTPPG